ncbi:MAG: hypothetical protein JWR16_2418 [Nevskia sp.]|nr:hypothetical protein [Nevskia sp.]
MPLPAQLKDLWDFLEQEVLWLHARWQILRQIYDTNPERINLINEASPTFFALLRPILLNDIQLTLSKLADPAATSGRSNLTLEAFLAAITNLPDPSLVSTLQPLLKNYQNACSSIKVRRNKDIAHFDLATQLKVTSFPAPSRNEIESALCSLRAFLDPINRQFLNTQVLYDRFPLHDDAELLLFVLKKGLRYDELQKDGAISEIDIVQSRYWGI